MDRKETFRNFIGSFQRLSIKFPAGEFLYRGLSDAYTDNGNIRLISSSLYRELSGGNKKLVEEVEEDIVNRAREMLYLPHASTLEILTDLQHHHGKTNCIDFTRSMLVALFFACYQDLDRDGAVFCLDAKKLRPLKEITYPETIKKNEVALIDPAPSQESKIRIISQNSVFLRPRHGCVPKGYYKSIRIRASAKRNILALLRDTFGISRNSIFRDLPGFIANEKNFETAAVAFEKAHARFEKNRKTQRFLEELNELLNTHPDYAPAYYERGQIHQYRSDLDQAIQDFSESIRLKHEVEDCRRRRNQCLSYKEKLEKDSARD
ncbi:MAG: FRG domain-containing protein [Betaproteobacteria bacterium AqS2]|uniref:FRG domain-containing protein n=1 Tax=Candidatus Amphirhobacter heronislandensis TaxID=1732024 RepID=A0A930UH10_9GAMM|nr:FRG domain-containing protein [Betaproteobacteria bacterium AqS2]